MELGTKEFNDSAMEMFGGKPKQQTAVEWLHEKLAQSSQEELVGNINLWFKQAKEMEKQQIIDAYCAAENNSEFFEYEHKYNREYLTAEPYYNETYNKTRNEYSDK